MQGEFRGDFSRDSFNPVKHFSRVLMQQGRVQLDADWNEQTSIVLHYLQTLASDLIGPFGGDGFEIKLTTQNNIPTFTIGSGHYYVDGILCENEKQLDAKGEELLLDYYNQPDYPIDKDQHPLPKDKDSAFLVYLDVWERHISYLEDDSIREVALEGIDTATRAKIVWQVRISAQLPEIKDKKDLYDKWTTLTEKWQPANRGLLKARGKQKATAETEPCLISPDMRYQGAENQLYRVEIHQGGKVQDGATFKWSRDNGAIALPILSLEGKILTVATIGRDPMLGISSDQWIEIIDDRSELLGSPGMLVQVVKVEGQTITLAHAIALPKDAKNLKARRWDYQSKNPKNGDLPLGSDNALLIQEGKDDDHWLTLEDGIQIQFQPGATYRTGDYWLIPARTAIGDIRWALDANKAPMALPPHGVEHHYAPLALLPTIRDCRQRIGSPK